MTIVDVHRPPAWRRSAASRALADAVLILAGSALVALSAQVVVPLPWTPVPITGQTFGVLFVGALLGSRRGALALTAYLLEGAAGLPVFAGGGSTLAWLAGPTAGYLWSCPLAAWLVGRLAERGWDRRFATAVLALAAGNAVIYAVGLPWLAFYVGWERVLVAGFFPFLPGAAVKIALAAAALSGAWRLAGTERRGTGEPAASG
ncbi:MAG TPA: biotin transporter BioY [Thermoanaerobaculia bacterium]|nr:biotin transporter BioY [Thermoanaerobaculia bacterium]